jgi:4-hydroxybenzoate polyprenyltransferase
VKLLLRLIDWVLFTSIFAAACATGICLATERLLLSGIPDIISPLHAFIFGSTLVVYNAHHLVKKAQLHRPDMQQWLTKNKNWNIAFLIFGLATAFVSFIFLPTIIKISCPVLGLLSFAYSLPMLPFKNKKRRLRDYGWVKIIVLATVWTIVTSLLPMLYWEKNPADYPFEILIRFVFMLTLCIAFDIRDMQTDNEQGISTLPNVLGLRNSYRLMNVTIVLFALLSIVQYLRFHIAGRLAGEIITAVAMKMATDYTRTHPTDHTYLGLVDGTMLLYSLLLFVN